MCNGFRGMVCVIAGVMLPALSMAYNAHRAPLAYRADVVMVGKILDISDQTELSFAVEGAKPNHTGKFQKMTVEVGEVLKDSTGQAKPLVGTKKTIVVLQEWPKTDKPDPARDTAPAVMESEWLAKDKKYVMVLHKIKDQDVFYLPNYYGNRESDGWIDQYRVPTDIEKWNWGKAVNGLQIAFFLCNDVVYVSRSHQPYVAVLFAIRNTTNKDITISLEPKPLHIVGIHGSTTVDPDLYAEIGKSQWIPVKQLTIKAGQVAFLNHMEEAVIQRQYAFPLPEGDWSLKVAYEFSGETPTDASPISKPAKPQDKKSPSRSGANATSRSIDRPKPFTAKPWVGRIESKAVKLKVEWKGPR